MIAVLIFVFFQFFMSKSKVRIKDETIYSVSALFAAIMKADNSIMRSELYSFRDFFLERFGYEAANKAIEYLKILKDENISIARESAVLNRELNYTEKLEIIRYLFQLAYADGAISDAEIRTIEEISENFQIRQMDYAYIKNTYTFYKAQQGYYNYSYNSSNCDRSSKTSSLDSDYALLGVKSTDSDEVIKKTYRHLAIDNHPDKVEHLGETARKEAEERFIKINEAYQRIKVARNIK